MEVSIDTMKCIYCKKDLNRGTIYYNLDKPFGLCRKCLIKLFISSDIKLEEVKLIKKEIILKKLK